MIYLSSALVIVSLLTGLAIAIEVRRSQQHMKIMNITWPVTGLYMPVFGLFVWRRLGKSAHHAGHQQHSQVSWRSAFISATHCGAGCVIGDIIAAPLSSLSGLTLGGSALLGHTLISFIAAFIVGIGFQYIPIREMGETSVGRALIKALKADTFSLTVFQAGMFLFIWVMRGGNPDSAPEILSFSFWAIMIIAMFIGYLFSVPANYLLIKAGIKHGM